MTTQGAWCTYACTVDRQRSGQAYKGLYRPARWDARRRPQRAAGKGQRPVLLIGGTNITLEAQCDLIDFLLRAGLPVAAIDYPVGSPLATATKPQAIRQWALRDFIFRLKAEEQVTGIDIVAHSYAAFEVVRMLMSAPLTYRPLIRSIVLVNPPGFVPIVPLTHCLYFLFIYVLAGGVKMSCRRFRHRRRSLTSGTPGGSDYAGRQVRGITSMFWTSLKNPLRSYREVQDIASFRIAPAMKVLSLKYGYDLNLFLNSDDSIVPFRNTLQAVRSFLGPENIQVVPGGHNDLIFQAWQRDAFLRFLQAVRWRNPLASGQGGSEGPRPGGLVACRRRCLRS